MYTTSYAPIEDKQKQYSRPGFKTYGTAGEATLKPVDDKKILSNFLDSSSAFADILTFNSKTGSLTAQIDQINNKISLADLCDYLEAYQPKSSFAAMATNAKNMLPSYMQAKPTADSLLTALAIEVSAEIKQVKKAVAQQNFGY